MNLFKKGKGGCYESINGCFGQPDATLGEGGQCDVLGCGDLDVCFSFEQFPFPCFLPSHEKW